MTRAPVPFLLPHEVFATLMSDEALAKSCVGADPAGFWERIAGVPYMAGHPIASDPTQWATCLPLGLHGDGVRFSATDSALAITWNGLLAQSRTPLCTRHLVTVVPTPFLLESSKFELSTVITWSLAAIMDGRHPPCDHTGQAWADPVRAARAGQPLAPPWKGAPVDFRGDWLHQSAFWRLPSATGKKMCWLCDATSKGPCSWVFAGPNARWRHRPHDTAWYLARRHTNPLSRLPGFRLQFIRVDEMHCIKLGIARFAVAGALLEMAQGGGFGPLPLDNQLQEAWASFREWRRQRRIQANPRRFTRERLGLGKGEFAHSASKAHNTRILIAWLCDKFLAWDQADASDRNKVTGMVLHGLSSMFHLMESSKGIFFQPQVAQQFCAAGERVVSGYLWLARDSTARGLLWWPARPKIHAVCHLISFVRDECRNPKHTGCMADEDVLGQLIRLAKVTARRSVAEGALFRYLVRMTRKWRGIEPLEAQRRKRRHPPDRAVRRRPPARP